MLSYASALLLLALPHTRIVQGIEHLCQNQNNTNACTMADYELHAPRAQHPHMPKHQVCYDRLMVGFTLYKATNYPIHTRLLYTPCIVVTLKACTQLASVPQFIQHQYALCEDNGKATKHGLKGWRYHPGLQWGQEGTRVPTTTVTSIQ